MDVAHIAGDQPVLPATARIFAEDPVQADLGTLQTKAKEIRFKDRLKRQAKLVIGPMCDAGVQLLYITPGDQVDLDGIGAGVVFGQLSDTVPGTAFFCIVIIHLLILVILRPQFSDITVIRRRITIYPRVKDESGARLRILRVDAPNGKKSLLEPAV